MVDTTQINLQPTRHYHSCGKCEGSYNCLCNTKQKLFGLCKGCTITTFRDYINKNDLKPENRLTTSSGWTSQLIESFDSDQPYYITSDELVFLVEADPKFMVTDHPLCELCYWGFGYVPININAFSDPMLAKIWYESDNRFKSEDGWHFTTCVCELNRMREESEAEGFRAEDFQYNEINSYLTALTNGFV